MGEIKWITGFHADKTCVTSVSDPPVVGGRLNGSLGGGALDVFP